MLTGKASKWMSSPTLFSTKSLCSDHYLLSYCTPPRHCVMFPSPMPVACALLFLWVCVLVPDRALLSARSNGWTSGQASLVVAPLVSLVKAKVCNSLLDQYNVMEGTKKHHKILISWLPAILDVIADAKKRTSRRGAKNVLYHCIPSWDDRKYI